MKLALFILINIIAAVFQSVVGLGHALIANPLSLTFLSKNTTLSAVIVVGTILSLNLSRKIQEPLDKEVFWPLIISACVGLPLGIFVLKSLPINDLRVLVGSVSIVCAVALQFIKVRLNRSTKLVAAVGFLCGVMQTSTGITGPPLAILLASLHVSKNSSRKIMATFFFLISLITLPLFMLSKVMTIQGVLFGIVTVPFILIASYYGNKLANRVPHRMYRLIVLVTVGVSGAYAIYQGVR